MRRSAALRGGRGLLGLAVIVVTVGSAPGRASADPRLDAARAAEAGLARSVSDLSRAADLAAVADTNAQATLASLAAAQVHAAGQLDAYRAAAAGERRDSGAHVRSLYESGEPLGVLGVVLSGGSPQDLLDRVRIATALGAADRAAASSAAGATGEADAAAAAIADDADAQLSIAGAAARRAAGLGADLQRATVLLADADLRTRYLLSVQEQAARAATLRTLAAARALQERIAASAAAAALTAGPALPPGRVPTSYRSAILRAGSSCRPTLTPALLAGQLQAESGWNPTAVSSSGALGLAQFLPGTWATHGIDADGDGTADPMDPLDAITSAAAYDCTLARTLANVPGDPTDTMLAGYNAGPGAVLAAGGIPADAGVRGYVRRIRQLALAFLTGGFGG